MKINTITNFKSFINEMDFINSSYAKERLYIMFIERDRDLYILDIEKRKLVETSQTFSLDSDWKSHSEIVTFYELYIETLSTLNVRDTMTLTLRTLNDLKKLEQFIKNNFEFLKRS